MGNTSHSTVKTGHANGSSLWSEWSPSLIDVLSVETGGSSLALFFLSIAVSSCTKRIIPIEMIP
jgi:hypothetical protein